jgi:non-canonical (house-cleaning) NTP pyrophosphatase
MTLFLTSKNKDKMEVAIRLCRCLDIPNIECVESNSGIIGGQPYGLDETEQGCKARTEQFINNENFISIENGFVKYSDALWYDIAFIYIRINNVYYSGWSDKRFFPSNLYKDTNNLIKYFEKNKIPRFIQLNDGVIKIVSQSPAMKSTSVGDIKKIIYTKETSMSSELTSTSTEGIMPKPPNKWDYLRVNFRVYLKKHNSCIKIQACWRGYNLRKEFKKLNDNYTFTIMNRCLDKYISNLEFNAEINLLMSRKKRRNENFPSDISENIAKFAIYKKYGIMPCWDTDKGDIIINKKDIFKQIEVKGFMSTGPSSFGPKENWELLYFVDALDITNKNFKVYEVKLSNKNEIFRNISISKKETYGNIADSGRRPRGGFYTIFKPQLGCHCKLIFDGHISKLDNPF